MPHTDTQPAIGRSLDMPWPLLIAACLTTFAVTASGSARSPFILDMSEDLNVSIPLIANLFGFTSVFWGIASYVAGRASDRFGRRAFLVLGPLGLALTCVGVANATSYASTAFWIMLSGAFCGTYTGVSMAEVSARVPDRQRGRALGWVMSGQSLNLLIGIPAAAWLGASIGWRGVHYCLAALVLACAIASALTASVRARPVRVTGHGPSAESPPPRATDTSVLKLLFAVVMERICFGLAAVYYPTFLQLSYAVSLRELPIPLAAFAFGNILGTTIGGVLADKYDSRRGVFRVNMLIAAALSLALFGWTPHLWLTILLGFGYAFSNALCRPALMSLIADVPAETRGRVMGLMGTFASLGWLGAAALGGWIMTGMGFAGFGPLILLLALLAVLLVRAQRLPG